MAASPDRSLIPDDYVHVLASEAPRPNACRASTPAGVAAWQAAFRPRLRSLLGIDRIAARGPCDLLPEHAGTEDCGDHIREEWTIQSEPGFRVPFFLLRPKDGDGEGAGPAAGQRPLVITPHGHGKAGKRTYAGLWADERERRELEEGERDVAVQAVREGYVAIAPDVRAFADLRLRQDRERDATSSCRTLQMHALLFGRTLVGERVWDVSRLIDYAGTRPEIDASRIVVTGNSGGGTVSLFAAACDLRIGIAVPSSYFCTFEASIGSIHHCECNYVPGLLAEAEMYDVAGLIAPRPFLAVAGRHDPIFPYPAVQEAFAHLQGIYAAAGVPEHCRLHTGEGGHRYYRAGVWPSVRQWLGEGAASAGAGA